jgi:hypothetical protein
MGETQLRTDTCANCGQTIHLVKTGPDTFRWATDPEKPKETSSCPAGTPSPDRIADLRHAPVSAREAHR